MILYAIWTIPILMLSSGYYYVQAGTEHATTFWAILLDYSWFFYLFASICPAIYRLTGRFPFTPATWHYTTLIHVLATTLVVAATLILMGIQRVLMNAVNVSLLESIIQQLTNSRAIFRSFMYMVYYVVVVGAMIMIRWNRQGKKQEARTKELELRASQLESQLANARLQSLKMQLRPHFLFNALNTISALVEDKQNDLAFKTIAQLGYLLRSSLKFPNATTISLRQELTFIDKYLTIEGIRFSDRLKTETDVPDDCLNAMVPALILQPVVENCIHHAAAVQSEPLHLCIRVYKEAASLVLEVSDDGPGLPRGWSIDTHAGVGLENIRQRLQVMYGDNAGLTLTPAASKGVTARIAIPFSISMPLPPEPFKNGHQQETDVQGRAPGAFDQEYGQEQEHEFSDSSIDR